MRILFLAHQFFPEHYAGVEIVTLGLAREFRRRGHETFVLAPKRSIPINDIRPGEVEEYEYGGVPVRRIGRPKEGIRRPYRLDYENETMARRVREYMEGVRPDVVHAEHFQGLSASVIPVIKEFGVPLVYTATDFWTICPVIDLRRHDGVLCEGPDLTHCPRCIASRYPGTRMQRAVDAMPDAAIKALGKLSENEKLQEKVLPLRQVWALKERPNFIREQMEQVDHIIAYTHLMKDLLLKNGIGKGRIGISHYGINTTNLFRPPRNLHLPPPLRIGFVGTLGPHKGCDTLIRAFKLLPPELEPTLDIHGSLGRFPVFLEELRGLAAGDGRINFAGPFSRGSLNLVLSGLDVLVVPSRWYENQPGVILEAFAAGVPVVATNLGGMSEFVKHEENGLLFEPEDERDLARQLRRLGEEPGLLEALRDGIAPVKTVEKDVDELEELYGTLIARDGQKARNARS